MAVQFKTSGTILFKATGTIAMDATCCCDEGCTPCCEGVANKPLFITISALTLDGGETCDAGCLPSITALGSFGDGGGETACGDVSTFWLEDPAIGTAEFSVLRCDDGVFVYDSEAIYVRDPATLCQIFFEPTDDWPLTGLVCDPFYWEGDIDVTVYDAGFAVCGTGTIHLVITE